MMPDATPVLDDRCTLPGLDLRGRRGRAYKAARIAIEADLGRNPNAADRRLIERAALLTVACESMEHALAMGEAVDTAKYSAIVGELRRVLGDLRAKQVES